MHLKRVILLLICSIGLAAPEALFSKCLPKVELSNTAPTAEEFVSLRAAAGMRERKIASAEKGIPNSLFWVTLRHQGRLIGMGRVVGDGGTVAQITDIAVAPEYQKQGYGTLIFERIQEFILAEIPDDAFVCLFAEQKIAPFYQAKGFQFSQDRWPGMFWPCLDRIKIKAQKSEPACAGPG